MNGILAIIFSILGTWAFAKPFEIIETAEISGRIQCGTILEEISAFLPVFSETLNPYSALLFGLLFVFFFCCLRKNSAFSPAALFLAMVFASLTLIGECAVKYHDLEPLFRNMPQILLSGMKFAGFGCVYYFAIRSGFAFLDRKQPEPAPNRIYTAIFENRAFIFPWLIIILCWLPWVIAFYPGFVPSDGLKQLNNYFGSGNFTDHHPAFSSFLMGWAMKAGRAMGSDNFGLFLFTFPQLLIVSASAASCFPTFKKLRTPAWLRWVTLFNFALISTWANYAYSLLKDSLYMAMLLLLTNQLILIFVDSDAFFREKKNIVLMCASLTLMVLMRHEGKYMAALMIGALLINKSFRKHLRSLMIILLVPLCVITLFNKVVRPMLGIPDGTIREAFSIPFRQSAMVVIKHRDLLNEEEKEGLEKAFGSPDKMVERYDPANGDGIKDLFDPYVSAEDMAEYLILWGKMLPKYLPDYLNAFFVCNSGYLYPEADVYRGIYGWYGIEQEPYVNKGLFDLHYLPATEWARTVLVNLAEAQPQIPFLSLFYSIGLNGWLILFCAVYLKQKRQDLLPILPGLLAYFLAQITTINGFFRYMVPTLICLPLCAAWCVFIGASSSRSLTDDETLKA